MHDPFVVCDHFSRKTYENYSPGEFCCGSTAAYRDWCVGAGSTAIGHSGQRPTNPTAGRSARARTCSLRARGAFWRDDERRVSDAAVDLSVGGNLGMNVGGNWDLGAVQTGEHKVR